MKNQQKEEAKNLYFQGGFTKTEIAEKLGVNRKTILFWSKQDNWETLRMSARSLPSLVAEKCYYLIDQYASQLLGEGVPISTVSLKDAQILHLLATTIKKLKNRSTVNESMEMFNFFLQSVGRKDPALAEQIVPQIEEYIADRKDVETTDFLLEDFNKDRSLPYPQKEMAEKWTDEKEYEELMQDFETFINNRNNPNIEDVAIDQGDTNQKQPDTRLSADDGTPLKEAA